MAGSTGGIPNSLFGQLAGGAQTGAIPLSTGAQAGLSYQGQPYTLGTLNQVQGNTSPTTNTGTGTGTGVSTGGYGGGAASSALIQQAYEPQIAGYQSQLGNVGNMQDAENASIQNQYNAQYNPLQHQMAQGNTNLDIAQGQLDNQRTVGLRNIGSNLRTALNGYQQQLGVMGAGDSSAAGLLGYGLTQQGNNQTQDLTNQNDLQQTGINAQRHDLTQNFQDQLGNLDAWKQSQLSNIALKYSQMQTQLQNQIASAKGSEAQYLAMYGQTALAQQAISSLQALEGQYNDQAGQLQAHFAALNAPTPQADISKYAGPYTVNPFNVSDLQNVSFANNQDKTPAPQSTAAINRKPDSSPNLGF